MKRYLTRISWLVGIAIGIAAGTAPPAAATVSVLVDEVHGLPCAEQLDAFLPQFDFTALTADDFPIDEMLASGTITVESMDIVFEVPAGAEALYARFQCSDVEQQYPFIRLRGPQGDIIAEHCYGAIHIEDPEPGEYELRYDSWYDIDTEYEIGTGAHFLTSDTIATYDLVCSAWDDTYFLFVGQIPPYSAREESTLTSYVDGGGSYLYIREPLVDIAVKPIINLYAAEELRCDIELRFPGTLTYAEPACETVAEDDYTRFLWDDLRVVPGQRSQILYEGKLSQHATWLEVVSVAEGLRVTNLTDFPLAELSLLRCLGADDWRLVRIEALPAGAETVAGPGAGLNRDALASHLEARLIDGGEKAGLYAAETSEFIDHYLWAERWLAEADDHPAAEANWCSLYRISAEAFADFTPLVAQPRPQQCQRALWVWSSGLGGDAATPEPPPALPMMPPGIHLGSSAQPGLIYHEYGILRQWGPGAERSALRTPDFLGWEFLDSAGLDDPVDNCGSSECVIFDRPGGSPASGEVLTAVGSVQGWVSGAVFAPWSQQLLTGGEHCSTPDGTFVPGSYPPVAVARELGSGRIAAVADLHMIDPVADNQRFFTNLVGWLARVQTAAPELPAMLTAIVSVAPNPFNPRTMVTFTSARRQTLVIAIHDLAGKRVAMLANGSFEAGTHTLTWLGSDDAGRALPSGVYLLRLVGDGVKEAEKVVLVR